MAIDEVTFKLIQEALGELDSRTEECQRYREYYRGDHQLTFATEKWENAFGDVLDKLRDNVCPIVVDSVVDRLQIKGFGIQATTSEESMVPPEQMGEPTPALDMDPDQEEGGVPEAPRDEHQKDRALIQTIWNRNRMDAQQDEVHEEVSKCGEAYVIVWPNEKGEAVIYPNDADSIYCKYDEESYLDVQWAVKRWVTDDNRIRINLYFPDRIEKYITTERAGLSVDDPVDWEPYYAEIEDLGDGIAIVEEWPLTNPYGQVPVFQFKNGSGCISDLYNVIPMQDALNKSVADMLVGGEFQAFPQRLITGLEAPRNEHGEEVDLPFRPGADRLWTLWGEAVKAQQFEAANLLQFLAQQNDFRTEIARISRTSPHMMMLVTSDIPSGRSLTVLDAPFVSKIKRLQKTLGNRWEDVAAFCVQVETSNEMKIMLTSEWAPAELEDPKEQAETLTLWQAMGVPKEIIWEKLGFTQEEIERMKKIVAAQPSPLSQVGNLMNRMAQEGQPPPGQTPPALAPFARMTSEATEGPPG